MEQKTFDRFIKLMRAGKCYTFEELKAQDHGECYYRFAPINNNTHVQLTYINDEMVLLVFHLKNGVYNDIYTIPVNKLEEHLNKDSHGEIYRFLYRINDKFEIMDEESLGKMFFGVSFDKRGFPTANKDFKLVNTGS